MNLEFLQQGLLQNNIVLSAHVQEKMLQYLELMQKWNRVFNLTRILDPHDMIMLHILDSLVLSPFLHGNRILDVGTGAGLPGIPLALMHPEKTFCLLDSNSKKTRFLTQAVIDLQLNNVNIVHERAEHFHPTLLFDSIVSRAFASLELMLDMTNHLLAEEGQFLAMKGVYPQKEIENITPTFTVLAVHLLAIKGLDAERHLVCIGRNTTWEK